MATILRATLERIRTMNFQSSSRSGKFDAAAASAALDHFDVAAAAFADSLLSREEGTTLEEACLKRKEGTTLEDSLLSREEGTTLEEAGYTPAEPEEGTTLEEAT